MILVDKLEQSATLHLSTNVFHGPALPIAKYLFPIAKMLPSCLQLSYQAIFGSFHPKSSQKKQKVKTVQTKFEMLPNGHFNIILSQKRGEICEGENPPPPFVECFMNVFGGRTCKIEFGAGRGDWVWWGWWVWRRREGIGVNNFCVWGYIYLMYCKHLVILSGKEQTPKSDKHLP